MTFDDGILTMYEVTNIEENGEMPEKGLVKKAESFFREETLGITRFYEALRSEQQIERVVVIHDDTIVSINDICTIDTDPEDANQYAVRMVQKATDEEGLKILRISLERNGDNYEIIG